MTNPQELLRRIPTLHEIDFVILKKRKTMKINQSKAPKIKVKERL